MIDERVVLAAALVHATHGSSMVVAGEDGRRLTIGRHPSADLDPCRWRAQVASAQRHPARCGLGAVRLVGVGGSLRRSGAGVWFAAGDPLARLIAAVDVDDRRLVEVLQATDLGSVPDESVTAVLRPDAQLGVSIIEVSIDAHGPRDAVDDVALRIHGALLVDRLSADLAGTPG